MRIPGHRRIIHIYRNNQHVRYKCTHGYNDDATNIVKDIFIKISNDIMSWKKGNFNKIITNII